MKFNNKILIILLITAVLLLAACSSGNDDNSEKISKSEKASLTDKEVVKAKGGEKMISVRGEYSYCYATPENHDPTMAFECVDNLTYKECLEWKNKEPGKGATFFYADFIGGEPTIPGRTANEYYMKIIYGDGLEGSDDLVIFPNMQDDFYVSDVEDCYPNATIEVRNKEGDLLGKMSFNYADE